MNTVSMLGQAYSLLGFQIVEGVVGAGFPQKPKHSAVFAQISPPGSRLTELARKANMTPQAMGELVDELVDMATSSVVLTPTTAGRNSSCSPGVAGMPWRQGFRRSQSSRSR